LGWILVSGLPDNKVNEINGSSHLAEDSIAILSGFHIFY
jgi:hypothetical protein